MTAVKVTEIIEEDSELKSYTAFWGNNNLSQMEQNQHLNAKRPATSLRIFNFNSKAPQAMLNRLHGAPWIPSVHKSQTNTSCNIEDM